MEILVNVAALGPLKVGTINCLLASGTTTGGKRGVMRFSRLYLLLEMKTWDVTPQSLSQLSEPHMKYFGPFCSTFLGTVLDILTDSHLVH